MIEIPSLRPETRYGIPPADHMLFNREYIVGYSYLFRQARWAMEVIDPENKAVNVERKDPFRADLRIPEQFRATLCLLYTSPSPRDLSTSRMPSSA